MKKVVFIVFGILLILSTASCATATSVKDQDIAGYTLKNKKEQMQQKILHKKNKTVIATP
ncbi:hypothetical protein INR76_02380 [Marixanthomonas sp. SCSIO 43207]|uniref:hypothetical protein n=1 Tax=Marixanthomonas sp. SCSIO 43207 TaxID=2779360 RepID=UPI001CA9EA8C|nr:hypothetical protein [Marixanthomonas sp. SCSIO 43207]UAB81628.1 hypothetical protein INR76_02380 [Marixanthomonas sp. SCSIO 43207]